MIVADPRNPVATAFEQALVAALDGRSLPEGLAVVIGGDGFMLRTVDQLGFEPVYLGLNAGHLGFLLNDVGEASWAPVADRLVDGDWAARAYPLLRAGFDRVDGRTGVERGINDAYLERATGQTARLRLVVDGSEVVDMLVCDGVIVSTALGSTGYTFSAGGPACHPDVDLLVVTPICPHQPRLAPFVLPPTATIDVEILHGERRPVRAVVDGRSIGEVHRVRIDYGQRRVRIAHFSDHDGNARMVAKILHP